MDKIVLSKIVAIIWGVCVCVCVCGGGGGGGGGGRNIKYYTLLIDTVLKMKQMLMSAMWIFLCLQFCIYLVDEKGCQLFCIFLEYLRHIDITVALKCIIWKEFIHLLNLLVRVSEHSYNEVGILTHCKIFEI